jgi:tight adherence protein B
VRSYVYLAWVFGVLVAAGVYYLGRQPAVFAVTFGLIAALLLTQLEAFRVGQVTAALESQLADAIDIMVGALGAGGSVLAALEMAASESRRPLRPVLEEVLGRIRLGGEAVGVLQRLEAQVPQETFRLFCTALAVHWETGGNLTPTLAAVGRVIRDRIDIGRRIRALTTQSRVSVLAVLGVTYFIGLIFYLNDPGRVRLFLSTTVGSYLVSGAILLQALGIVWTSRLSRLRY